jgi:hypothetical protein
LRFATEILHLVGGRSARRVAASRLLPASRNSFDKPYYIDDAMPSRRQSSGYALLPTQPFQGDADLSSAEKLSTCRAPNVLIASSAGCFSGPDFCLIFPPCGYDDPEILPS